MKRQRQLTLGAAALAAVVALLGGGITTEAKAADCGASGDRILSYPVHSKRTGQQIALLEI